MDVILIVLAMIALLLLQGFFSGSEIALVHADRLKLHNLANKGNEGASRILHMFHKPEILLGTTLVGTNLSLVTLTTLGTILMIRLFGENGDLIAFLIFTPIFLIFGEVVPKSVYQQKADTFSIIIIYPLQFFSWLFYPVILLFSWVSKRVAHLIGVEVSSRELFVNREQVASVIEMAEQGADIDVFDRDRIMRVLRFADATVGQAMVPIAEMTTIGSKKTTKSVIKMANKYGHFRIPVFKDEKNQIIGVVLLTMWKLMDPELKKQDLLKLVQPVLYVTPHQLLDDLLPILQQRDDHMAIVVDEYESAIGMITLEDILEEIVGEVINVGYTFEDHMLRQKYHIDKLKDDVFLMDARVPVVDVNAELDIFLPSTEAHTIGGLLISRLRHLPLSGEYIIQSGYRFTVQQVSERGIQKIRVERIE
jgi:CBS domain containing-hemolysin-like protein